LLLKGSHSTSAEDAAFADHRRKFWSFLWSSMIQCQ
jgi:hypothetical protein